ncbi:MAG: winged helix-turn-helix domain-containing protein, partial [Lysobacter sp.]
MPQRIDRIKNLAAVSQFRIGELLVQPDRLAIVRDGVVTALEPRMMEVLIALAERAGEVISAEQLLIEIWRGTFYGDNPVHKTIAQLRRRLGDSSREPDYVETIRKRGYRLVARVSFPDDYRSGLPRAAAWTQGSPYVGLRSFDETHTGVFFGRSRATAELLATLREQVDNQRRFVLVAGASGCGKTSLLRAAVMPLLRQDGGFDGLHALSSAYFDLGACLGGDLLVRLAQSLCEWSLDGRPVFLPSESEWMIRSLRDAPEALHARLEDAFARHTGALAERAHLLLVVDHAEAAVAAPGITQADRRDFGAALTALCASPRVATIAIARSDFYPALIERVPGLAELKAGDGHIDLLTPRLGEIGQIIRAPAALAGLSFEEDPESSIRLDDLLRDAAAAHPDSLPLLQHTLQALYERQDTQGVLSLATYRELGGLEGALAHRAEQVYAELPAAAQASLERVLAALIVIRPDSDAVTGRRVLWSSLDDAAARELAEAFVRARLFVGELSGGEPGFGVAHEALLRQWPRAREWARENRQLLQARERLQRSAQRWVSEGRRTDHLLNPGRPLAEAREAARRLPDDLDADDLQFLHASERQQRRKQWLRASAIGALCALALVAIGLGLQAWQARREAESRRDQAQQLVSFMLGDLAEQLRPLGNLKLLDSVGSQALIYLEHMPEGEMQPRELVSHARALRTVGEVLMNLGRFAEARSAFERAQEASALAVAGAPDSQEALFESGTTAYWLGYYNYQNNRYDAAREHWLAYLRASEALVKRAPADPRWQLELSYALNNLGTLANIGHRSDEAADLFARSVAIKRDLLTRKPTDKTLRYELVDSLSWLSTVQDARGELAAAAQGYAAQTQVLRELVDSEPDADEWRRKLATSLLRSSILALDRGLTEDAEREIAEALRVLGELVEQQPDNRDWRRNLGHAYVHAGWVAHLRGASALARERLSRAQAALAPLLSQPEPLPDWRLLDTLVRLRQSQTDPSPPPAAIDALIADLQALQTRTPDDIPILTMLARALVWR